MQIILVPNGLKPARTLEIKPLHIVAGIGVLVCVIFTAAAFLSWLSVLWQLPTEEELLSAADRSLAQQAETIFDRNLKALAARVGELQARMIRLDSQSRRLSEQTGTQPPPRTDQGRGGPFVPAPLNEDTLRQEIERLASQIEKKSLELDKAEKVVRAEQLRNALLPTTLPVRGGASLGSPFGVRIDPFGRGRAMHEGLDFTAPYGTPILAAADGVVVYAAYHPEFGKCVEINHGGELITRYAHMSALSVEHGEPVRRGQKIGELGSTGRSTGAHLHFEVRQNGLAIDPAMFLSQLNQGRSKIAASSNPP